ncbi:MAG: MetQ/NlpA family ABC transporter substrate-binding protein [Gammaproteobacteria bacterium]
MTKYLSGALLAGFILIAGCSQDQDKQQPIKVGTIAGPETALMEVAKKVAKEQYGLDINIVEFSDYATPNTALNDGSIDANAIQTLTYFEATLAAKGYQLTPIGVTFIYPMGIYSSKIDDLSELADNTTVVIPNDPSNEERALLLLQKAGLITLDEIANGYTALRNIADNPKRLRLRALDSAQLPRALADVDIAVINTNYAVPAGLSPTKDALFTEGEDSSYVNIIAVRTEDKDNEALQQLVKSYQSQAVVDEAEKLFNGTAIPAW